MKDRFLPAGSVVLLKGGSHKVMIVGFCSAAGVPERKLYDYIGVLFPEGLIKFDQNFLFDHKDIVQIFNVGYENDEAVQFNKHLKRFVANNVDENGMLKMAPDDILKEVNK